MIWLIDLFMSSTNNFYAEEAGPTTKLSTLKQAWSPHTTTTLVQVFIKERTQPEARRPSEKEHPSNQTIEETYNYVPSF